MANLFGFEIRRAVDPQEEQDKQPAFAPEIKDDGAVVVAAGGAYGTYVDLQGAARTEAELVTKYREMSMHPEVERATDDILNEAIVLEDKEKIVQINLDDTKLSTNIKKLITTEFESVLTLLDFNKSAYDIFKRWYVDGRMYYHIIIDITKPNEGIKELRYIDPRKLRKIREIKRKRDRQSQVTQTQTVQEYFIYNEKGFQNKAGEVGTATSVQGLKIAPDSIIHTTSGVLDPMNTVVLSHLHKAIKPLNQLRALEDATIVYRISRAPERRIFYIDVGNLPKMKAEQYMRDMMQRHKNKVVYDSSTGEVRDDRKFMTMLEDYWLPRRDGSRGTEITTLPAGQNLGELADVEYFQKKLYESLNVPTTRLQQDGAFIFGQDQEVSRDEIKFGKFIDRLRMRFNHLFLEALKKQLLLKNVMMEEDWEAIESNVKFDYTKDNYFEQQKTTTVMRDRLTSLDQLQPYIGKYYSNEWVRKHVLYQSDEEIEEMDEQNMSEQENPLYKQQVDEGGNTVQGGNAPPGQNNPQGPGGGGFGSVAPTEQFN
jgi:hypothetical protein